MKILFALLVAVALGGIARAQEPAIGQAPPAYQAPQAPAIPQEPIGGQPPLGAQEPANAKPPISEQEAYELAKEAYVYLYPLVMMDVTRKVMTNAPRGKKPGAGPINEFAHVREYPPADFHDVVRANFDTLYSVAWLDLRKEPIILSTPDTAGRYYLLPLLDMWTDVFAAPGKRTSGVAPANFLIAPQGWKGKRAGRRRANRRANAFRVDHRPHANQRAKGLRGRARCPGRLQADAPLAMEQTRKTRGCVQA